jgi:hypothetical protein
MSDDDKNNKIELVEGEMDFDYAPTQIKKIVETEPNQLGNGSPISTGERDEMMIESFVSPESDGFSLDFIQKNRTNDHIRRNFLSKLTY